MIVALLILCALNNVALVCIAWRYRARRRRPSLADVIERVLSEHEAAKRAVRARGYVGPNTAA